MCIMTLGKEFNKTQRETSGLARFIFIASNLIFKLFISLICNNVISSVIRNSAQFGNKLYIAYTGLRQKVNLENAVGL